MASKTEQRKIEIIANGKKFNASFKEMAAAARVLENQLKKMPRHTKEWVAKSKELRKIKTSLREMRQEMNGTQRAMGRISGMFTPFTAGAAGLAVVLRQAFNTIKNFQQGAANLAAVLGTTRSEIGELTEDAKRLGAQTAFTAAEVTGLQTEYAKLGFSKDEILGVTEATLNLAAATGTDLAQSASVAGGTLRAFNLDVSQTKRVTDVMAKSFSSSALDMEKFTTAMAAVGPVAANAGESIESTTAKIGVLVDRNIDASTAGTALRNIFLDLSKQGLSWEEAMQQINSAADKNAKAFELFGKRGATVAAILAENGDLVEELEGKLLDAGGTAKQMADEQLNTLQGRITKLKSAWEGFILSIEDGEGVIAGFIGGTLEFFSNALRDLSNIDAILELAFNDLKDVSEETLGVLIQFGKTDAGNKVADVLKRIYEGVSNEEFVNNVERNRKVFIDAFVAEGESAEDALILFEYYFRQRMKLYAQDLKAKQDALKAQEEAEAKAEAARKERLRQRREELRRQKEERELERLGDFIKDIEETNKQNKKKRKEEKRALDERLADLKKFNDERLKLLDDRYKNEIKKIEEGEGRKSEVQQMAFALINQVVQAAFAVHQRNMAQNFAEERARLGEQYQTELDLLRNKLDKGYISESEFEKKKRELDKRAAEDKYRVDVEEFKAERRTAIGRIAIETAIAVAKAIARAPLSFGLPWSAFATAQGAIQTAVVLAQKPPPRPRFAEGGYTDVGTFKYGGMVERPSIGEIGEAGPEWVAPNWMLKAPRYADILGWLEYERRRGIKSFADGGVTVGQQTQPGNGVPDSMVEELTLLRNDMRDLLREIGRWPTRLQVVNNVQDTADKLSVLNEIESDARIRRAGQ